MSVSAISSSNGAFAVTGIPPGSYDVEVKHGQSLSRRAAGLVFHADTSISRDFGALLAGDVNDDNSVTITDFAVLSAGFGLAHGQSGFDPRADLDGNGVVDVLDFALLSSNFGRSGPSL